MSFYASPEWADLRARCKARDGYRCRRCGWRASSRWDRSRLHAHHVVDRARGGRDRLDNLITLCADCHVKAHSGNRGLRASVAGKSGAPMFKARFARPAGSRSPNLFRARTPGPPKRFR